ncbi:MAG TPA: substrate-binding domain-containing protein [Anaerolineales bacterium]|nr:substrate-binding domain-containing protein [Anaerolineales bacterium]
MIEHVKTAYERQQTILRLLREQPGIKVTNLADLLDVSVGTIRNDLNALESLERVKRVRGGAILFEQPRIERPPTEEIPNARAKNRIAHWAAEMVEDGDAILLDASTTVRCMTPYLKERRNLTIITNGLHTARSLTTETAHTVILIGGIVSPDGAATTSQMSNGILENLHIRTAFVSGVGFTVAAGLTERNFEEAQLKQTMLASAQRTVVLLDSTKIGKVGFAPLASLNQITSVLTDSDVSTDFIDQVREAGVNLLVCGEKTVRSYSVHEGKPRYTLGFANQSEELPFAVAVRRGVERAVAAYPGIDLIIADNKLSGEEALRVADQLIARGVDLAIEYQIDYQTGSLIMDKFQRAGVPVIAVDIPMVGATFFGVDNYRCGHVAGIAFGEWLRREWQGGFDYLVVLEELRAGSLPAARIKGQLDGLAEVIGRIPEEKIIRLDSGNTSSVSEAEVVKTLHAYPTKHRFAVVSFNTDAAIGALRAARRSGRERDVAIVGQGADQLLLDEIRHPDSRVIGSTAYMPEHYGEKLMQLALKLLQGEPVPPAVYTDHIFITAENIEKYYPLLRQGQPPG